MPMLLLRLLLIITAAVTVTGHPSPACARGAQAGTKPILVDIAPLASFFTRLPPDEQEEQLRDWALFGLRNNLGLPPEKSIPIRRQVQQYAATAEVAPGRVFAVSSREWGVLIPWKLMYSKAQIGGLVDRRFAQTNTLPERISIYGYGYDAAQKTIRISRDRTMNAADIYSAAYGYVTTAAASPHELENFSRRVDDIVQVRLKPDRIELGGRRYRQDERGMLTVEEIAALYQAYNVPLTGRDKDSYESMIRRKLDDMIKQDGSLRAALKAGTTSESSQLDALRRSYPPDSALNRETTIGFSLDPARNYRGLADAMEGYARELANIPNPYGSRNTTSYQSHIAAIESAARSVRSGNDTKPLLALMAKYDQSPYEHERDVGTMLHSLELRHSYQSSRYIGDLQGTAAGMILFYTDLLAKLWAFDYEGSAPKGAVTGFRSMVDITVPKLYWNDFLRLTQSRLWFGLRQEGFNLYGDRLLFQPVATRVYAASSSPLVPGKESRPNYQSGEFLGWWDRHYETVAEYEPYYRKLNQIQKWSTLFMILKEKRSRHLNFLGAVQVRRTLDFEQWLKQNGPSLTSPVKIPFLDRKIYGRDTECLPLLISRNHQLMGRSFVLGGGVTLASRREILIKMFEHDAATLKEQQEAAQQVESLPGGSGEPRRSVAPVHTDTPRPQQQTERADASAPAVPRKADSTQSFGRFSAEKHVGTLRLKWEKSPSIAAEELVDTLAELQQAAGRGGTGEVLLRNIADIRSTVSIKEGASYLVRTAATGSNWIQLSINPAEEEKYPARASATFPEADIFCARIISDAEARASAGGRMQLPN